MLEAGGSAVQPGDLATLAQAVKDAQEDITEAAEKISGVQTDVETLSEDVLKKDNTVAFTPTADYHPSTKKYVDDSVGDAGGGDMLKTVYDPQNKARDIFAYVDEVGGSTASMPTFVYQCTGTADSTAVADTVNDFFNNGTAMAMKLIISGTMGVAFTDTYYAVFSKMKMQRMVFKNAAP